MGLAETMSEDWPIEDSKSSHVAKPAWRASERDRVVSRIAQDVVHRTGRWMPSEYGNRSVDRGQEV